MKITLFAIETKKYGEQVTVKYWYPIAVFYNKSI